MATIVYQGLQACLESQVLESRTMRLRLSSPKPHFSQSLQLALKPRSNIKELGDKYPYEEIGQKTDFLEDKDSSSNPDLCGCSFLQALSDPSEGPKQSMLEKENTFVHSLTNHSSSTLSEMSLELCTENLGSETGTCIIENSVFAFSPSCSEVENYSTRKQQKPRRLLGAKKVNSHSFPPPLTTITGSESLQIRPHREDGRLIIEAVKVPPIHAYFHAERSHGRLRLSFVKDSALNFDYEDVESKEDNESSNEGSNRKEGTEKDVNCHEGGEETDEDDEACEIQGGKCASLEEMDGNNLEVGAEMGLQELQKPTRRCKEGDLEFYNQEVHLREPFYVTTS